MCKFTASNNAHEIKTKSCKVGAVSVEADLDFLLHSFPYNLYNRFWWIKFKCFALSKTIDRCFSFSYRKVDFFDFFLVYLILDCIFAKRLAWHVVAKSNFWNYFQYIFVYLWSRSPGSLEVCLYFRLGRNGCAWQPSVIRLRVS